MLVSTRKSAFAAAAAILFAAPAAQAEIHDIMIFDDAYYPNTIYIQPGDELLFTNSSASTHEVVGDGEAWTSGPIGVEGSFSINVTSEMPLTFSRAVDGESDGDDGEAVADFEGTLSYDEPPLGD